jgi:hypothetical protein
MIVDEKALQKIDCLRCGHRWIPRKRDVRKCPNCKTALFDVPKKNKNEKKHKRRKTDA